MSVCGHVHPCKNQCFCSICEFYYLIDIQDALHIHSCNTSPIMERFTYLLSFLFLYFSFSSRDVILIAARVGWWGNPCKMTKPRIYIDHGNAYCNEDGYDNKQGFLLLQLAVPYLCFISSVCGLLLRVDKAMDNAGSCPVTD